MERTGPEVPQRTHNSKVAGSIPAGPTLHPDIRLTVHVLVRRFPVRDLLARGTRSTSMTVRWRTLHTRSRRGNAALAHA
jgi:hypothetical protein